MRERVLWIAVAAVIAAVGILALTQATGFPDEEGDFPYRLVRLTSSLAASAISGTALLSGLALVRQGRLLPVSATLLLSTPVIYTLLLVGIWDESFAEHHQKLLESVSVIALALALLGPLFALTRLRDLATFVLTLVTTILILAAAILALVLIGRRHASDASATDLEILTILAVTAFFLTPVIERAIEQGERAAPAGRPGGPA